MEERRMPKRNRFNEARPASEVVCDEFCDEYQ